MPLTVVFNRCSPKFRWYLRSSSSSCYSKFLFGLLLLLQLPGLSLAVGIDRGVVELNGLEAVRELGHVALELADPTGAMTVSGAQQALAAGEFQPVPGRHFDAGYSITPFWIAIPVANMTQHDSSFLLSSNIPYVPALSAVLLRSGAEAKTMAPELLLEKLENSLRQRDQFLGQSVVSRPFLLKPAETAMLLVRFKPYGIGVLPMSIETPATLIEKAAAADRVLLSFYTFALTSLVLFLVFVLAMRHTGGVYFIVLFGCGLIMMLQLDGLLNQWVWPEWPRWEKVASFPLLLLLCSATFATAAYMLRAVGPTRFWKISRALCISCFFPLLLVPFIEAAWLILIGFVFMLLAMALIAYAVINWARFLRGKALVASGIAVFIFVCVGFFLYDVLSGEANLSAQNLINVKILYVLLTMIIILSYATQVAAMNREFAESVERDLNHARNEARISAELLESERRYSHAQKLVTRQSNRLANASHDLRQPIASLRMTLDAITRKADGSVDENVVRAFDYLDELVSNHLVETDEENQLIAQSEDKVETIDAALVTRTVVEMFAEEAEAKGLQLRHVESSLELRASPMPVMRIVSNLVSNAVKYTESGGVLIGSHRRGANVAIEVFDTGGGLHKSELRRLAVRHEKGELSAGEGLGLAICYELAALHGFLLTARSVRGQGSRFTLSVPTA